MRKKEKQLFEKLDNWEAELIRWIRKTRPTIYTQLEHVSQSGMFRRISVCVMRNNKPVWINELIDKLTIYKTDKRKTGLRVSGCGMDMGFAVVYNFSSKVFPYGFKYRKNELHRNGDPAPIDPNGGYALKQRWL
jgi:hypothetical protein